MGIFIFCREKKINENLYAYNIFNTEIALAFKPIIIHCFHGKFHGQKQEKNPHRIHSIESPWKMFVNIYLRRKSTLKALYIKAHTNTHT